MTLANEIVGLVFQGIAIIFMITMIILAIWAFIIANKAFNQIKYQNYLLEKIAQNIYLIKDKKNNIKNEKNSTEYISDNYIEK
ncbi:hypothetical protein [Clostridium tarantellae]|uniref:Uncharacterized protein n=1 Tax=Clostridium tarantellae TaxID=39493 RepID=A0A6I1MJU5_9CLOT|nr:hypothetical protein [Clostridium tarantellae]MPQ43360.1 hypothetical protein [Clostridium tarantellae]